MKIRHSLFVSSAILLFLGGLYLGNSTRLTQPPRPAVALVAQVSPAPAQPTPQLSTGAILHSRRVSTSTVSQPSKIPTIVAQSISAVLPQIQEPIDDWRQFRPEHLSVNVDGLALTFDKFATKEVKHHAVWLGSLAGEQGASMVTCATKDAWFGAIAVPGLPNYEVTIKNNLASVRIIDPSQSPCGVIEAAPRPAAAMIAAPQVVATKAEASALPNNVAADTLYVDVMFFYEKLALASAGDETTIANRMIAYLESSNVTLMNSNITNFLWRYVGISPVDYTSQLASGSTTQQDMNADLGAFVNSSTTLGAFVRQTGDAAYADQRVLIEGGSSGYGGLAYVPGNHSVVSWTYGNANTLTHEMGHNFGCQHDRVTVNPTTLNSGDGLYCYGFSFKLTQNGTQLQYGTVMSYSTPIPYFSSPDITYSGVVIGLPAGDPLASDNARMIREHASGLINYRTAPEAGAPQIARQPSDSTVAVGGVQTFTVTVIGANISYQWKKNNVALGGATTSSYTIASVVASDAGNYTIVATNSSGSVTSAVAILTVTTTIAPWFSSQPMSQGTTTGGSVTFTASASGTPAPSYQWQKNGVNIIGATSNSFTKYNVSAADAGNYTVVATSIAGSVTSFIATLTVKAYPVFTTQPTNQIRMIGNSVTFTAIASGTPTPAYQWQKNGINIPGATISSYVIASVVAGDAGNFQAIATNSLGSAASNVASLTFIIPPSSAIISFTVQ